METEQCVEMVRAIVWRIGLEVPTVIDVQLDEKEVDVSTTVFFFFPSFSSGRREASDTW